jgi:hypothetical protein
MIVTVATSDRYLPALKVYSWLFRKYWNGQQRVVVAGYSTPDFDLPSNFLFHSIGNQDEYPVNRWSNGMYKFLTAIDEELILFMLEDYWIVREVDVRGIGYLVKYMTDHPEVARIDLTWDRLYSGGPRYPGDIPYYAQAGHLDLIYSKPGTPYQLSLMAGLWRRESLMRLMIPNESPQELEMRGTERINILADQGEEHVVLGTRQSPIRHILAHRGGDTSLVNMSDVHPDDVEEMLKRGLLTWQTE